ncbi:hypothetical protein FEM48_Zijuj09G0221200 [Ziziphus jujuba var. spinosa]|uniref:Uncharacterized protein n=1 Tax=Ziziphus jujuba var. spinosa TaxID=714518 RepID=A0A978UVK9_ZIZJJ|nr:hypothetical protein FEM48_Zijuj09G0221200 [Ziziphus jujuba var. spinosa]
MKNRGRLFQIERPRLIALLISAVISAVIVIVLSRMYVNSSLPLSSTFLCSNSGKYFTPEAAEYATTPTQLLAILHYATSNIVPQQSINEIRVSFEVLKSLAPCNFLVFGLGFDSLMWASLNPGGTTLFLEEDPKWVQTIVGKTPILQAHSVQYRTQLSEADKLLASYKSEPDCLPANARVSKNSRCRLVLSELPDEVYEREWDLIMIDAPRGYFPEAPGRMAAIFSAAVMARDRKGQGVTHVFLHDVNRKVEKMFAEEFLCRKYLVKAVGRLWHFVIPPVAIEDRNTSTFC